MTTVGHRLDLRHEPLQAVRVGSALVALIVVIDALSVGAPGLALIAVPFVIAAFRFKHGTVWGSALVALTCALYVLLGASYAIAHGADAPWGDLLFAYVGTPLAASALLLTVRELDRLHA
jgi:hypothetical protein